MAWVDWVLPPLGIASLVGAVVLARHAGRNWAAWIAIVAVAAFAFNQTVPWTHAILGDGTPRVFISFWLVSTLASVMFALAYPGYSLTPWRRWAIAWLSIVGAGAFVGLLLGAWKADGVWLPSEIVFYASDAVAALAAPLVVAATWWRAPPGAARHEAAWAFSPFLFWIVHDGIRGVSGSGDALWIAVGVANLAGVLAVGGLGVWALTRWVARRERQDAGFASAIGGIFAVSTVQFLVPGEVGNVHLVIDSLAVVLLLYAVARHRVLDIDLKLRWTVRRGTLVGVFAGVFLIASELAQSVLADEYGYLAGAIAAGLLLFAIGPLQRLSERVTERTVPVRGSTENYLAYRRMHVYRAALEGMLRDGVLDPREAKALEGLRDELGITLEEHDLMDRELRGKIVSAQLN